MAIDFEDKKQIIELKRRKTNKGYVFKLNTRLDNNTMMQLHQSLVRQLKSGILIYPTDLLELIDIYQFERKEVEYGKKN